jgi:aminoglycoside phosphotransferase (APT) family kinase protein
MISEFKNIPNSKGWMRIDLVDKGWSGDKKYHITTEDNLQLLLRVSHISAFDCKKEEYKVMKMLDSCNILMSRPIDFGVCNDNKSVFTLLTWLEGTEAEVALSALTTEEQYCLGYNAGKALGELHKFPAPANLEAWSERFNRKIDQKIRNYEACEFKIEKSNKIIDYINDNRFLLENRIQTFQHGDFHVGNMIVAGNNQVGIIDFNRYDYGDPWEEFNRIVWCAQNSGYFASGRINGYFEDNVPEKFFRLMALYIGSNTLSSVPWAVEFGEKEVNTMLNQAKDILDWYSDFTSYIPKWYIPHNEM